MRGNTFGTTFNFDINATDEEDNDSQLIKPNNRSNQSLDKKNKFISFQFGQKISLGSKIKHVSN